MPLTDTATRNAKPGATARKLADGGGMYLLVTPAGGRLWRMDYRFNGKRLTLALGPYPDVSLSDARGRREAARKLLAAGTDPGVQRKIDKLIGDAAAANTFKEVAEELLTKREREGRAEATMTKDRWLLDFAYPHIGARPIGDIEPPELLAVLRRLEAKGILESARRLRSLCGRVFRYAIATGRAKRDLSADLAGALTAPKVKHRAAVLVPKQVGALIRAIDGYDGHLTTKFALKLAALTFVRPGELRYGEWSEISLEDAVWRIPGERMKMKQPHLVPLSRQAVEVLRQLHQVTGGGRYLFPSIRSPKRVMSENTVNAALRRMGYASDEASGHGFRRTASTLLNERGFNRDWIERQLAHADSDEIRAAYNAAEWLPERTAMMQEWADHLGQLAADTGRRVETLAT